MLRPGSRAPDFELLAHDGSSVKLSKMLEERNVVLYFYPKDGTPGCTREACMFRDRFDEIARRGAAILAVSPDSVESHADFQKRHSLPFILLSDPDKRVARMYGAVGFLGLLVKRTTYVIDKLGVIRHSYVGMRPERHVEEALKALEQLTD